VDCRGGERKGGEGRGKEGVGWWVEGEAGGGGGEGSGGSGKWERARYRGGGGEESHARSSEPHHGGSFLPTVKGISRFSPSEGRVGRFIFDVIIFSLKKGREDSLSK